MSPPLRTINRRNALTVAVLVSLLAPTALAQEVSSSASESEAIDKVTVTGTRIARDGFVTPSPVTGITAEEIRATGATNIGELMTSMPQLTPTYTLGNSSRYIGTTGLSLLDLRGMGTSRTLVLVNGRRHVGSTAGSSAVDVNTIPVEWIDRVEVITGGASAVYGADAVAGVVNFILKKDFEGFAARAQTGFTDEGGLRRSLASVTGGAAFADGRGNIAASLEVSRQNNMMLTERKLGRTQWRQRPNPNFDPGQPSSQKNPESIWDSPGGLYSYSTGGTFLAGGTRYLFNPDGSVRAANMGTVAGNNCFNCDFLNLNDVTEMQPEYRRIGFNIAASYELNDNHRLFFEGKFNRSNSKSFGQPTFDGITITRDNAFINSDLAALMDTNGLTRIRMNRFNVDVGLRGQKIERDTQRYVVGLEGALSENWDYEVSLNYGQSEVKTLYLNNRLWDRWHAGIDAVRDANGNIVCRSGMAGCVPVNLFGNGAVSPAAANWLNINSPDYTRLTQAVFSASVNTGNLFSLPAGDVGFAGGVEYRRERSYRRVDPIVASGATFMNALASSGGGYSVKEVFTELSIPVLADLPLVERFAVDLAGRYSKYSTAGSTKTWNIGLDWTLNSQFRVRSTYAQAVRAPSIAELFNPQSENFASISDPCNTHASNSNRPNTAADPALRRANCAALGIPADWIDTYSASRPGVSGGNPNLLPETARSLSAGFVWQPEFLQGFGLSVDYWRVNLTNAIGSVNAQTNATRCVDAPGGIANPFCNAIRRAPTGGYTDQRGNFFPEHSIYYWGALSENLAQSRRIGVDVEVDYRFDLAGGKMVTRLVGTRMLQSREWAFQDFPDEYVEYLTASTDPRWRASFDLKYSRDAWRAGWMMNYVHRNLRVRPDSYASNPGQVSPIWNGGHVVHNINFGYLFKSGVDLSVGINNLTDKDPPLAYYGTGVASALYDSMGRYYFVGLNYRF